MIGIISDIHGNYVALKAVLTALDGMNVKRVVCLGDVGGYYCQVNECCDALRDRNIPTLMGNHDWYLVAGNNCPRSTSANICLDYQRQAITLENLAWLSASPPMALIETLSIVHGGWHDPIDEYVVPSERYFENIDGVAFASGHTHVQCVWSNDKKLYCNPGSVGQPRDGDPRAAFALWNGQDFFMHRIEYNVSSVATEMEKAGFSSYFYENLKTGTQIGGKLSVVPEEVCNSITHS